MWGDRKPLYDILLPMIIPLLILLFLFMQETYQTYRSVIASSPHFDHTGTLPSCFCGRFGPTRCLPPSWSIRDHHCRLGTKIRNKCDGEDTRSPLEWAIRCVSWFLLGCVLGSNFLWPTLSMVNNSSVITVQIFDKRKFKRRDEGFLGVVNIEMASYLDLELDGPSMFSGLLSSCMTS